MSIAVGIALSIWSFAASPLRLPAVAQLPVYFAQIDAHADSSAEISQLLEAGDRAHDEAEDQAAADYYQQALSLIEEQETNGSEPVQKGAALYGLGRAYHYLRDDAAARSPLEAALEIYKLTSATDPTRHTDTRLDLNGLLSVNARRTGGYATSLGYSYSALALAEANDYPEEVAFLYHNIGATEADIGQYETAQVNLQTAVTLSRRLGNGLSEASGVFALGWVREQQEDFERAIAYYQAAISLFSSLRQQGITENQTEEDLKDIINREVRAYNNLGIIQIKRDNLTAAQASFDKSLELLRQSDLTERSALIERSVVLDSVGSLNQAKGDIDRAWTNYFQSWQIAWKNGDPAKEIPVLLNLGELMQSQSEPELAIFFYKQAIVKLETIRTDLQALSRSVQQRYTRSVESAYRTLADLLLQQGRAAEALQVLELLKLQEVKSYLHNEREGQTAGAQQFNTPAEATLLQALAELPADISLAAFVAHPAAIALKTSPESSQPSTDTFSLTAIDALNQAIAHQPNTAALYPLILEDRLVLLLFTPEGRVEHFTTEVSAGQLQATVSELQKSLQNKALNAKPAAQQLYQWLIQPLADTLTAQQVENIIYLPDGVLRYVPLSALRDGDRWLVETYRSHTITAAGIDDLTAQNEAPIGVMAGAFTDSSVVHQVEVGAQSFQYPGLSAAQQEVDNLMQAVPGSAAVLNQDFSPGKLLAGVGDRPILHLATHAQFIPGEPEDSFILFGDGDTVSLRDLQQWRLPNVDLVVLSACQTASNTEGDGKEILGLGYQMQATGAKAAIASLWSVDDTATAALMSQFYRHLSTGKTKADALRAAQIDLIGDDIFSNPYDWAAFILIGNGL